MLLRNILILISFITIFAACNSNSPKKNDDNSPYVAVIDSSMTLLEVAKANNIGEPYLRSQLGIKKGIGKMYTITQMSKRFGFDIDELRQVIEDRKNKQSQKKSKSGGKK